MTGFVQVAPDSTGKSLDNDVVQIPAGTVITGQDGSTSVLAAPAYYYRERIVNADPADPVALAAVRRALIGNRDDYGLTVRMPENNPDLDAIKFLLTDIDASLQTLAQFASQPQPSQQMALPLVGGLPPSQISPTVPRAVVGDVFGRQIVVPHAVREMAASQATTITSSTSETTILTAGDSQTFNDVIGIIAANTSATATRVDIRDQFSTVTTIPASQNGIMPLYLPAGDMRGISLGGVIIKQTNAGQAWTATCGTSVADVRIWVLYIKNRSQ